MSLRNEVINADVIEERDGIRALSTTELGWVSGGNGKKNDDSKTDKEQSVISDVLSQVSKAISIEGSVKVSYTHTKSADGGETTNVTVSFEVSAGKGKGKD